MVNSSDIINWSQGPMALVTHAGTSTNHWYGWVLVFSLWFIILFTLLATIDKKWAVAAASFIGMIVAAAGFVFQWNGEGLVILMVVLFIVGAAVGFVADRI